jgi:Fic family protein
MYHSIEQFEPLFPTLAVGELEELARALVASSAKLDARLAPETLAGIYELLRVVNSYYSNLIEGHNTHPVDIERAMKLDYSANEEKRNLQMESLIHIGIQREIPALLEEYPVTSKEFLCRLHREFYERLPESLRWVKGSGSETARVEAGVVRERFVAVGEHVAPAPEALEDFLTRFAAFYDPSSMTGMRPFVAAAAAHHRLMWIHPFLDGNGRVTRLFTDAYFVKTGLAGYGLWNVSRGLARRRDDYRAFLAIADSPRASDLDGRGNLSDRGLGRFCRFFLEICLDQTEFMNGLLVLNGFLERLERYVRLRNDGLIVDEKGGRLPSLAASSAKILTHVAVRGEVSRGDAALVAGASERTGRNVLKSLLDEGLLVSRSEKGAVRLGFPAAAAGYWFPDLYPAQI